MPFKKSAEATPDYEAIATPDYEAMRAARELTADENKWLKKIAEAFKNPGEKEMNGEKLAEQVSQGDSKKP